MNSAERTLPVEDDSRDIELILAALTEHNLATAVVQSRDGVNVMGNLYRRRSFAQRSSGNPVVIASDTNGQHPHYRR